MSKPVLDEQLLIDEGLAELSEVRAAEQREELEDRRLFLEIMAAFDDLDMRDDNDALDTLEARDEDGYSDGSDYDDHGDYGWEPHPDDWYSDFDDEWKPAAEPVRDDAERIKQAWLDGQLDPRPYAEQAAEREAAEERLARRSYTR